MKTKYIIILVTCANKREAKRIGHELLDRKLVACANMIQGVESQFWWKGKIDKADETLVIFKTIGRNFEEVRRTVRGLHSYDVPEIIALPIEAGDKDYLDWIKDSVK